MQELTFVRFQSGTSKTSNKPYSFVEVTDGVDSFTLKIDPVLGNKLNDKLEKMDKFSAEVHVENSFRGLTGTIVETDVV